MNPKNGKKRPFRFVTNKKHQPLKKNFWAGHNESATIAVHHFKITLLNNSLTKNFKTSGQMRTNEFNGRKNTNVGLNHWKKQTQACF